MQQQAADSVVFTAPVAVPFSRDEDDVISGHLMRNNVRGASALRMSEMWRELVDALNRDKELIQARWEEIKPPPKSRLWVDEVGFILSGGCW
jgi:hypothetical protein